MFQLFPPVRRYPVPPPNQTQPHSDRWGFLEAVGAGTLTVALVYYLGHPDNIFSDIISPEKVPSIPFLPPHPKKKDESSSSFGTVMLVLFGAIMIGLAVWMRRNSNKDKAKQIYRRMANMVGSENTTRRSPSSSSSSNEDTSSDKNSEGFDAVVGQDGGNRHIATDAFRTLDGLIDNVGGKISGFTTSVQRGLNSVYEWAANKNITKSRKNGVKE